MAHPTNEQAAGIIALIVGAVVAFFAWLGWLAREESREFALGGKDATVTVVSVRGAGVKDSEVRADCDLDVVLSNEGTFRDASAYRLSDVRLWAPVLWLSRLQPGLVLRARVHPTKPGKLRLYLDDGSEGRVY